MSRPFAITCATESLTLDTAGRGKISFTISNATGRTVRARFTLQPQKGLDPAWLAIDGDSEREFTADGTEQLTVRANVPPGTPAGSFAFTVLVADVSNPDERYAEGPTVSLTVASAPSPVPGRFPWWILAALGVLLIVGGAVALLLSRAPGLGKTCKAEKGERACRKGLVCATERAVCLVPLGETCASSADCVSALCDETSRRCVVPAPPPPPPPPPPPDAGCPPGSDCAPKPKSVCAGSTAPGNTAWQQYGTNGVYVDVDTSRCGFSATPLYFTSLGGATSHWWTNGATSIYEPTPNGFRVYVYNNDGSITPQIANDRGWYLNWQATLNNLREPDLCTGQTLPGRTGWQQYGSNGLYIDIDTAHCGFSALPLYFTSLGGATSHWMTNGVTSIYQPTPNGFRVYIYGNEGNITPQIANERGWYLNWQATPNNLQGREVCTGQTPPGRTGWQQYGGNGVYIDVDTSRCGFSAPPLYFTSLGGATNHWWTNGGTSIYEPQASSFRIYIYNNDGNITPQIANERGWYIEWSARMP